MSAVKWEDVLANDKKFVLSLLRASQKRVCDWISWMSRHSQDVTQAERQAAAIDAAIARLAEPAPSAAAERWLAAPADAKERIALRLESMLIKARVDDRGDDAAAVEIVLAMLYDAGRSGR